VVPLLDAGLKMCRLLARGTPYGESVAKGAYACIKCPSASQLQAHCSVLGGLLLDSQTGFPIVGYTNGQLATSSGKPRSRPEHDFINRKQNPELFSLCASLAHK
jgi:hypothetical protein